MMLRGIHGTYVYACDKSLRDYFRQHVAVQLPEENSTADVDEIAIEPWVNSVPLYDLRAVAGDFSPPQRVEAVEWILVPSHIRPSRDLFACRVVGNSMNKVIADGATALFRRYDGGSRDGKIVLVMLNDFQDPDSGSHFTVKEYHSTKRRGSGSGSWQHQVISLQPLSYDAGYEPIELFDDAAKRLEVIGLFERVL